MPNTATAYDFRPYDVLQINREGGWLDYVTIRNADEAIEAAAVVRNGRAWGQPADFRIVRGCAETVVYPA